MHTWLMREDFVSVFVNVPANVLLFIPGTDYSGFEALHTDSVCNASKNNTFSLSFYTTDILEKDRLNVLFFVCSETCSHLKTWK